MGYTHAINICSDRYKCDFFLGILNHFKHDINFYELAILFFIYITI